jgi:exopolysaccharide biosynthesis polyprenyl glycosylphosphotransferase
LGQVCLDALGVAIAYQVTVLVRVALNDVFHRSFSGDLSYQLMPPLPFMIAVYLTAFAIAGLYEGAANRSPLEVLGRVARGSTLAAMLIVVGGFFLSRNVYSRSLVLTLLMTSILALGLLRILRSSAVSFMRQRGLWVQKVAILGNGRRSDKIARHLQQEGNQYWVAGRIVPPGQQVASDNGLAVLGGIQDLESVINQYRIDRILVTDDGLSEAHYLDVARACERMGVQLDKTADVFGEVPKRLWVVRGLPLVSIVSVDLSRWDQIIKRFLDLAAGLLLSLLLLPLLSLIALVIRIESPGPILFTQLRRGKGGRYFKMLKFRSMRIGAEKERSQYRHLNATDGALFKMCDDPRVTRVGRILRKFSLDELPQLLNVMRGEMSLVGPRPLPHNDVEAFLDDSNLRYWIDKREDVLPGITGLWQIRGRSELSFDEMLTLDIHYIKNWSFGMDLEILARTLPIVVTGRGAY